ncbi:Vacuolar protein-sorting-associated protein 60 [Microbotryomycetes sp. JL201]|nr:Vacuolar protein-sorting-associated protein 60 [Microbotryomycetes sp. JL201]
MDFSTTGVDSWHVYDTYAGADLSSFDIDLYRPEPTLSRAPDAASQRVASIGDTETSTDALFGYVAGLTSQSKANMNRLFGASASKPKPSLTDAIASTDQRIDSIEVKIRKLDAELTKYRDQMKKMRDGPGKSAVQQRALRVLKQKKMYEAQIGQLQQQTFNMEQAALTTENLRNTMATVDAMKTANKELKKQYGKLDVDKIEQMHFEMEDLIESANEVQESMSRTYGIPDEVDEADLEAELDALADDFEEEEGIPSYLQQDATTELPDFVDEAPAPKERLGEGVV